MKTTLQTSPRNDLKTIGPIALECPSAQDVGRLGKASQDKYDGVECGAATPSAPSKPSGQVAPTPSYRLTVQDRAQMGLAGVCGAAGGYVAGAAGGWLLGACLGISSLASHNAENEGAAAQRILYVASWGALTGQILGALALGQLTFAGRGDCIARDALNAKRD